MLLTVRTPSHTLFEGEVSDATITTGIGQITILPNHAPLTTIVESGILRCTPVDQSLATDQTFVFDKKRISLAIGGGMAYIDGKNILILGIAGSKKSELTTEELNNKKIDIETKIKEHKKNGDLNKLEKELANMATISAEIELSHISK